MNSTDKFSPRLNRKNTASTKVANDTALKNNAWRMNGMSLCILKNSICFSEVISSTVVLTSLPASARSVYRDIPAWRLPHGANRHALEFFLPSVPQVDQAAREKHAREHAG